MTREEQQRQIDECAAFLASCANKPEEVETSAFERVEQRLKDHKWNLFKERELTPTEGWAVIDRHMERVAPDVKYDRGDGWWTKAHCVLFDSREDAEYYCAEWTPDWEKFRRIEFVSGRAV